MTGVEVQNQLMSPTPETIPVLICGDPQTEVDGGKDDETGFEKLSGLVVCNANLACRKH